MSTLLSHFLVPTGASGADRMGCAGGTVLRTGLAAGTFVDCPSRGSSGPASREVGWGPRDRGVAPEESEVPLMTLLPDDSLGA